MHTRCFQLIALIAALLLCASCRQPHVAPSPDERQIGSGVYDGPPVTVDVIVQRYLDPNEYIAVVEITAPTGGWNASLDHAQVNEQEDDDSVAVLFITLQGPGENEVVTQALEPHHLTHRTDQVFESAKVYVRLHHRDRAVGEYRLAAE